MLKTDVEGWVKTVKALEDTIYGQRKEIERAGYDIRRMQDDLAEVRRDLVATKRAAQAWQEKAEATTRWWSARPNVRHLVEALLMRIVRADNPAAEAAEAATEFAALPEDRMDELRKMHGRHVWSR